MIDLEREEEVTVKEAAARCDVDPKTIRYWMAKTDYRKRLKDRYLESVAKGGRIVTTVEAIRRFLSHDKKPMPIAQDHAALAAYLKANHGITI